VVQNANMWLTSWRNISYNTPNHTSTRRFNMVQYGSLHWRAD